ncbi:MAG: PilZ domain-containing protein [Bradyrhizobium sp.]|uniref:PilZ domain-containing protein n=1 Tax=Bradyrhizobium sp. TaxID=376 RepID=UPI0025B9523E|nr:PilZ domain-containing protein [Bradyrhizobium sp.]MBI5260282.1 PilZ domain-containing protein [Bradyrhizobium sp.]
MEEKRKHQRIQIDEPAYVSSGGSVMSCTVTNMSVAGAAIDVENPAFIPPRFRLIMARDSSVRDCRVVWIQKNRIGLAFVASPQEPEAH